MGCRALTLTSSPTCLRILDTENLVQSPIGSIATERLQSALKRATDALVRELKPEGHWVGKLSSSALSTATAVTALSNVDRATHAALIDGGLRWLAENRNADGGWGDTVKSKSNISTTALCWAAFGGGWGGCDVSGGSRDARPGSRVTSASAS